ncbi:hypothetical protein B5X24_HaOG205751 [Helicoverpa armigera]|uniref:Uncharacterized protein n=1 Tax=Helicoverpa armigera TaxID=29058 RepID=A0A2W1BN33_HELAM|nr:hypothetical protein B5X24_HaOG205751 [Helicoverpa armigera]
MIGKSRRAKKGEACVCPTGQTCTACKNKKGVRVKPNIYVERSSDLPVPIRITTYKYSTPTTVQFLQKQKVRSHSEKTDPIESTNRGTKLCQWYRRRRALRELDKLTRLERKRLESLQLEKARRIREAEFLELLEQREKEIRYAEQQLQLTPKIDYSENKLKKQKKLPKTANLDSVGVSGYPNKRFKRRQKIKYTEAKPVLTSRKVATKPLKDPKDSFNERFGNFCYRVCCQCYCCVSFIIIIGILFMFLF